jgi:hypothetical protein
VFCASDDVVLLVFVLTQKEGRRGRAFCASDDVVLPVFVLTQKAGRR